MKIHLALWGMATSLLAASATPMAANNPNSLVLWGDDIVVVNTRADNLGGMGYQTPIIDAIAAESALFAGSCAQQSFTAGRASFIPGQQPFRPG